MKFQAPPGMRDFYPEDMRLQNWLMDTWRQVSRSFGFSEYEGPIFEYLDLYTVKSGEGIVSELFNFEDRGGRRFAIRPEMTPTLARMVAARANSLPRPIKWFSIPRLCRAERPQRGRLREFFQWNVDILGVDDVMADAEVIAVAVEFFRRLRLSPEQIVVKLNSRELTVGILETSGVPHDRMDGALQLIDRLDRIPEREFVELWDAKFQTLSAKLLLQTVLPKVQTAGAFEYVQELGPAAAPYWHLFQELWANLEALGVAKFCELDLRIVRGLDYYTGVVFEVHARSGGLRALMGGGRYDNLTEMLDGPKVSGVGFGMGDAPVFELLKELGRLPEVSESLDVFVIDADRERFRDVRQIVGRIRRAGLSADFSYKRAPIGKQFKQAAARGARYAVVVGVEFTERNELAVKDLSTGIQTAVDADAFMKDPKSHLTSSKGT